MIRCIAASTRARADSHRYNITGVERPVGDLPFETYKRKHGHRHDKPKDDCSKPENEDKPHCVFAKLPRYYNKTSPSRRNSPLTPLGFTQFYLPDVDSRKKTPPEWQVEYATFKPAKLLPNASESGWNQPPPVPFHLLPGWKEEVQVAMQSGDEGMVEAYRRRLKGITPWRMKDLTIGSYVKLARKLVVEKKMWNKFTELMWVVSAL
jgi:endopolyphosphatase